MPEAAALEQVSRYKVIRKLGEGGMGAVYLAQDTALDRKVALKVLPAELASNPDFLNRFVREAKVASALSHPNVAYIYEIGNLKDLWFIAMEYVTGRPLAARIAEGPLPVKEVIQ